VGHDDDIGINHCNQLDAAVDILDHHAIALVLAFERAAGAMRGHAVKMH